MGTWRIEILPLCNARKMCGYVVPKWHFSMFCDSSFVSGAHFQQTRCHADAFCHSTTTELISAIVYSRLQAISAKWCFYFRSHRVWGITDKSHFKSVVQVFTLYRYEKSSNRVTLTSMKRFYLTYHNRKKTKQYFYYILS